MVCFSQIAADFLAQYNQLFPMFEVISVKRTILLLFAMLLLGACSSMISSATKDMANNLNAAILNQNDLETVRQGAPAYLIMIDSFIEGAPRDVDLLVAGSKLYVAYSSAFVSDPERAMRLSNKALQYSQRAFCVKRGDLCNIRELRFPEFEKKLRRIEHSDVAELYTWGVAWAGWIQARTSDWLAIADIPKIKAIMRRTVELDPGWDHGGAQLYLGVLNSLLPPAMGGKPDQARDYFEQALELDQGRNLMMKTLYAQYYARLVFNRDLHDRLLNEVLQGNAEVQGLTLTNTLAQEEARKLLAESADYF